jgi:Na+-transporting methylmalonyl-CoA/oxaloacetate decarboxylase gamma subunit
MEHREKMFVIFCPILAMLENKFAVGSTLPKVQTRTLVDVFVDISYLCVFISCASAFIVRFIAEEMNESTAWMVDYILLSINVVVMVGMISYVAYSVSRVEEDIGDWLKHAQAQRLAQSSLKDVAAMAVKNSKGLSRKIKAKAKRGSSVLDVGGGRKAGGNVGKQKHKHSIHKAVYDVKVGGLFV